LDHEWTHIQQELMCGALTHECHASSRLSWLGQFVLIEMHAHVFGGPLIFFSGLGVATLLGCAAFILCKMAIASL
jgi:hypothetical protein